jgi:osmotically-inducible protein OsmY
MRTEAIRRAKNGLLDDDQLQQLITDRMDEDPSFWTGTGKNRTVINVQVDDGDVTLMGVVRTAMDRRRAELLARALGASTVDNRLRVSDETPSSPKPRRVA